MTPEQWQRVKQVLAAALERAPEKRPAYLDEVCAEPSLRREVESLIAAHEQQDSSFLERPAVRDDVLTSGTKLGPYEISASIGAGGMGEVYRARDTRLKREVAVKVLPAVFSSDADRLRRFAQEARAAGQLNHPNILAIYDVGSHDGISYVVSELLEGGTLRERLDGAPLPPRRAIDYALQVAHGLAAAHEKGIVHRDLKPENLFITRDERVKILDFGLAKLAPTEGPAGGETSAPTISGATDPGAVLGTVGYMSPEQVRGQPADHRADIFAFGAILYEMLSGRRAFKHDSAAETMTAILKEDPPELAAINRNVSPALERVVSHCLEKSPEQRFQSAHDLAFALETVSGISVSGQAQGALKGLRPRLRFQPVLAAAVLVAAISIAAFLVERKTGTVSSARALTISQLTFRNGNTTAARFAPDGHTIVYSAAWDGNPLNVYTTSTEGPESRSLGLPGVGLLAISRSGEMAVIVGCEYNWGYCQGKLARVPLAGGAPRELLEHVYYADWSPDGQTLAVVHASAGRYQLEYPIGNVLYEAPGWIRDIRVSPKGDRIAFLDHPVLGQLGGSVCVVDLSGKKSVLSAGWALLDGGLGWSPSGDEVWFTGAREGGSSRQGIIGVNLSGRERVVMASMGDVGLFDVASDGRILADNGAGYNGQARMMCLAPGAAHEQDLYWLDWSTVADLSADGKTLLFYEWGSGVGFKPTVYLRRTDGSDAVRLGEGRPLALSPDGKWALAVQGELPPRLVLLPTGTGQPKLLPRGALNEYYLAAWFPDGARIMFAGSEPGHLPRTYTQDLDGGAPQPLTSEGMVGTLLSPDGQLMAAVDRYHEYQLVPVKGGEARPIDGLTEGDVLLQWSGDGHALFVRGRGDLTLKIFRIDLPTGRRELWKELRPADRTGLIGIATDPGQVRLTPDGKSWVYTYWTVRSELYLVQGVR